MLRSKVIEAVSVVLVLVASSASGDDAAEPRQLKLEPVRFENPTELSETQRDRAKAILAKAWSHGESLRSWEFNAVVKFEYATSPEDLQKSVVVKKTLAECRCIYDGENDRHRCDSQVMDGTNEIRIIVSPKGTLTWDLTSGILLRSPDTKLAGNRAGIWLIDPRCIAWCDPISQKGMSDPYDFIRHKRFSPEDVVESVDVNEQYVELRWLPDPRAMVSLFFDIKNHSLPVMFAVRQNFNGLDRGEFDPATIVTTTWTTVEKIPVPSKLIAREVYRSKTLKVAGYKQETIDFTWVQINQPCDEKQFTSSGLGLLGGTRVFGPVGGRNLQIGLTDADGEIRETPIR